MDLNNLMSEETRVKYGCAREAAELSEKDPGKLYDDFGIFRELIRGNNNILRWNAIRIVGNLAAVDDKGKIEEILEELLPLVEGPSMITAANTIKALAVIAIKKPHLKDKIIGALIGVENAVYYIKGEVSPECTNVALGHVVKALKKLGRDVCLRTDVQEFLKRQTNNSRKKVREGVEELLEKGKRQKS